MSEKIESPSYDARLNWATTNKCNLNCVYCINNYPDKKNAELAKIDIPALLTTLERTNKTFRINFAGGEPFLVPNIIEACLRITEKHFVSFNTNLIVPRIKEFADRVNPRRVVKIAATAHIMELERCRMLEIYVRHFLLLKKRKFNMEARVVAYPELTEKIGQHKQLFEEKGIELKFLPFVGKYKGRFYPFSYTDEELGAFGLNDRLSIKNCFQQSRRVCNAGYNAAIIMPSGDTYMCDRVKLKLGNIYNGGITFKKKLAVCPFRFCNCPFGEIDPPLLQKALSECIERPEQINPYYLYYSIICKETDRRIGIIGLFLRRRAPGIYFACKKFRSFFRNA